MHVLILHDEVPADARADEIDVLVQAGAVERALDAAGFTHGRAAFGLDLGAVAARIRAERPDVVFNLVESVARSGRLAPLAPALLDTLGVDYTGARSAGMQLSTSKLLTKLALRAFDLPAPPGVTADDLGGDRAPAPGRWVLKSVHEHGSLGIEADLVVAVEERAELRALLRARQPDLGGEAFAEPYVHGREFNVALLAAPGTPQGVECLPIAEIRFAGADDGSPRVVGYRAKWAPGSHEDRATPRAFDFPPSDRELLGRLSELACSVWTAFGLGGWARVDFRVDERGDPWIIDVNANPCLSPDAGFAAAVERAGIPFARAVERVVRAAVRGGADVPYPTDRR